MSTPTEQQIRSVAERLAAVIVEEGFTIKDGELAFFLARRSIRDANRIRMHIATSRRSAKKKTQAERKRNTVRQETVDVSYIADAVGMSETTIRGMIGRDNFPRVIPSGTTGKRKLFLKDEVDEWLEAWRLNRLPEEHLTTEQKALVNRWKPFFKHR